MRPSIPFPEAGEVFGEGEGEGEGEGLVFGEGEGLVLGEGDGLGVGRHWLYHSLT